MNMKRRTCYIHNLLSLHNLSFFIAFPVTPNLAEKSKELHLFGISKNGRQTNSGVILKTHFTAKSVQVCV